MSTREPVPGDVYDAALRYYVRAAGDADAAVLRAWAGRRYPGRHPSDPADLAFWALSAAASFGVARTVSG
jgi:hypothetical protein